MGNTKKKLKKEKRVIYFFKKESLRNFPFCAEAGVKVESCHAGESAVNMKRGLCGDFLHL